MEEPISKSSTSVDPIACSSKTVDLAVEDSLEIEELLGESKPKNMSSGAIKLRGWLNKTLRIEMSDGRILIGVFLCTDRDANVILGTCSEYLPEETEKTDEIFPSSNHTLEEPRMLGLVMVPGKHIVSIYIDQNEFLEGAQMGKLSLDDDVM